jgi:hypothetical protein
MNTAIPTPFDIIDPSPGALVPSGMAWIVLLLGAVVAFLLTSVFSRRTRAQSLNTLVAALLQELQSIGAQASNPHELERVARLGRRILATYLPEDTAGLSSVEMRALSETLHQKDSELLVSASKALVALADVEDRAYAPSGATDKNPENTAAVQNLVDQLENLVRRQRPS